ncbi:hypothetical protein [Actinoplanes sp. HUAS TT8]|uniref:hypothetical protein n=1 Tax=Actinoplanes sp. HUAS TT8 TaxID=3447453 RepID=UPI003F51EE77
MSVRRRSVAGYAVNELTHARGRRLLIVATPHAHARPLPLKVRARLAVAGWC